MHSIKPSALISEIKQNMRAGINTMIWGGPGIGKSEIPQQVADSLGMNLIDFRANLFDPVDVRGVPHIMQEKETGKRFTRWAVPDVFPIKSRDGDTGMMFIDELPTAPPATQNAFLQLLLTRRIGDYELPSGWSMLAAGNRLTDAAAVYQMPSPVRNRLAHYELEANIDDWVSWAYANNVSPEVIGFLQYRPNLLYSFSADEYAFPTPRAWAFVNKKLRVQPDNVDHDSLFFGISSIVGDGPAGEFLAYKEISDKLPDIDKLLEDPSAYKKDDNPAVLYALSSAVAARAVDNKMENIMKLAKKIPVEFQVILVKGCLAVDKNLKSNKHCRQWIVDNANVIL